MPSILSEFEYDIFISYRQKDNQYDGWVSEFVDNLQKELDATFKEEISIYFDENPHDGLLETHSVGKSLEGKLKCLVFIPVISRTYCDPNSFAWQNEFLAFNKIASSDKFGISIKLANGNIAERVLPVRIHDLDDEDVELYESTLHEVLRPVDFIYRLPGVNRQLRARDDEQIKGPDQILYRDQINKVANAIREIISGLKKFVDQPQEPDEVAPMKDSSLLIEEDVQKETSITTSKGGFLKSTLIFAVVLIGALATYFTLDWMNKQKARNELLPAIQNMVEDNFHPPIETYHMALEAEKLIPEDSSLINLWPGVAYTVSIDTDPQGADIYLRDYNDVISEWHHLGTTPLKDVRIPKIYLRYEIRKEGYQTIERAVRRPQSVTVYHMDSVNKLPENMVRIPAKTSDMLIVGMEQNKGKDVGEFLVDKYEVTNSQFKEFIDDNGYIDSKYWQEPITQEGVAISLDSARKLFVDRTGRPGPSTWEAGTYPDGLQDHPVTGISWYEAAAYATYMKKELPTVYHWANIAETGRTENIIPMSNFNGQGTVPVGSLPGYSTYGIYDLAGNVREWCANTGGDDQRFILGGGWNDPIYSFNDGYRQPALDRSISNGFRCIKLLAEDTASANLYEPVSMAFRDYMTEKPVNDETFDIFRRQFQYDKNPLDAEVESIIENEFWTAEKVTIDAGYNNEKLQVYLYLPKNGKPPYQTVLFFPGSGDIYRRQYDPESIWSIDFILKSGRAIIRPIYKGTNERFDELDSDLPEETVFYKDHVIMWRKEVGRSIDYLESREDIQSDKIGYLGWSWGGFMGGIIPAVEPRLKAIVLNVGGMAMQKSLPEVDQINFLPRVKQPVLMLNGKHDMFFPVETSQKPMFELLGTPEKDKKIIIYKSGHLVPKTNFIREGLNWYDKYLGPIH